MNRPLQHRPHSDTPKRWRARRFAAVVRMTPINDWRFFRLPV
jgi:hypothetical protein